MLDRDSVVAAQAWLMQLTALRASLTHRMCGHLRVFWRCPLTGANGRAAGATIKAALGFVSAAFRISEAAEWRLLSGRLDAIYSVRSSDAKATAVSVTAIMADMAKLLPFAVCSPRRCSDCYVSHCSIAVLRWKVALFTVLCRQFFFTKSLCWRRWL